MVERHVHRATITDLSSAGLTIQFANNMQGFVPIRELSWSRLHQIPYEHYEVGDIVHVVSHEDAKSSVSNRFSIKRIAPDPWDSNSNRYKLDNAYVGRVVSIFDDAIFVELEDGISCRVATHKIGPSWVSKNERSVRLNDLIRVELTNRDENRRNFDGSNRLAIDALNNERKNRSKILSAAPLESATKAPTSYSTGSIKILLIDDDLAFCEATKRTFELSGHEMEFSVSAVEGIQMALANQFDIVVIDLVMPDMHGLDVCRKISEQDSSVKMAIFTGESKVLLEDLSGIHPAPLILRKPFDVADVEAACFDKASSPLRLVPTLKARLTGTESQVDGARSQNTDEYVCAEVRKLYDRFGYTVMILMKWLEFDQRLVTLDAEGLTVKGDFEKMERQLYYSRLRNIAESKDIIVGDAMSDCSESFRRSFERVFPFTEFFESFLGAPIVAHGHTRYILFFGDAVTGAFDDDTKQIILNELRVLGAEIAAQEAYEKIESQQRQVLRGELTSSLAHEIRNRLHIISMNMKSMKKLGPRAAHKLNQAKADVPAELDELNQVLAESQLALDKLSDVVTSLTEDITDKGYSNFSLGELARSVCNRLSLIAKRENVAVEVVTTEEVRVTGPQARLGQVIENIVLNAIQHTRAFHKAGGAVRVSYGEDKDSDCWFLEVEDNGEGIHTQDFERIFEMGYTTKKSGSGVGLALCAAAMAASNGRVFVRHSVLFEGTIIRVEWNEQRS